MPARIFYTLRCCSQGAGPQREQLIAMMGCRREKLRVHHRGRRRRVRREDARAIRNIRALLVAAKLTGRPVAWMSTRSEAFLSDQQARDTVTDVELAIDEKGKFLALRVKHIATMGAYHRRARRAYPDQQFLALLSRHVRDPAHRGRRAMRVHQHGADRALPRRRTAGGELRAGAAGGRGRARHRHRSDPAAPAQSDRAPADSLQDRGRHDLRLRRLRADPRQGAGACALRRIQEAPPRVVRRGKLRGIGVSCFLEHAGGAADRERVAAVSRRRQARARHRRAEHRPGPCHGLSAPGRRQARHSGGADRASARRYQSRPEGQSLGRLALDHDGRQRALSRRRPDAGEGKADRRRHAGSRRVPMSTYRDGNFDVVGTDRRVSLFEVAARAKATRRARSTPRRRSTRRRPSRTAATSPRSRSIRIPAWSRSSPMRRWTMPASCSITRWSRASWSAARAGHRAGADGERRLRRGQRAARHRHVHGLRDAARRPTCRRSPRRTTTFPRPPIRSA